MTLKVKGWGDSGRWRCYILVMRYADGGSLIAVGRAKHEAVRFEAAEMFGQGLRPPEVAPLITGVAEVGVRLARNLAPPALQRMAGARTSGGPSPVWPS